MCYFAIIGAFLNRPQTINAAISAKTIFAPITDASPLDIWKIQAQIINIIIDRAAIGVSFGFIRNNAGSINPSPPNKSTIPVNFSKAIGMWATHGHMADNLPTGVNIFIQAPQIKMAAKSTCAIQRKILSVFEDFC
jgi:hypothetical protein